MRTRYTYRAFNNIFFLLHKTLSPGLGKKFALASSRNNYMYNFDIILLKCVFHSEIYRQKINKYILNVIMLNSGFAWATKYWMPASHPIFGCLSWDNFQFEQLNISIEHNNWVLDWEKSLLKQAQWRNVSCLFNTDGKKSSI